MTSTLSETLTRCYSGLPQRILQPGECQTTRNKMCNLCFSSWITYEEELKQKETAVQQWWKSLDIDVQCAPIVPSPLGRMYRTVSKRKAFLVDNDFSLALIGVDEDSSKSYPMAIGHCVIEPQSHTEVYAVVQEFLQRNGNAPFAEDFNYVIVKGDQRECSVILNMNHFSSGNRRGINQLSKKITAHVPSVKSVFVFLDEERSKYYLSDRPRKNDSSNKHHLQKIFGAEKIFHTVHGKKFLYSPLSFSQTNHSILKQFIKIAGDLLGLQKDETFFDFYCGYGLFSLCFADVAKQVIGVELSHSSITDAVDNARRNKTANVKFLAADISVQSLRRLFKSHGLEQRIGSSLKVLLDPPRSGTAQGVIELIAEQSPERVVHIFCNTEIVKKELDRWKKSGYIPDNIVPIDMFPGTNGIEVMVSLKKSLNNLGTSL